MRHRLTSMYSPSRARSEIGANPALAQQPQMGAGQGHLLQPVQPAFRSPRRVTITLAFATYTELQQRADDEGRSLSNLAAFLLETALRPAKGSAAPAENGPRNLGQGAR